MALVAGAAVFAYSAKAVITANSIPEIGGRGVGHSLHCLIAVFLGGDIVFIC